MQELARSPLRVADATASAAVTGLVPVWGGQDGATANAAQQTQAGAAGPVPVSRPPSVQGVRLVGKEGRRLRFEVDVCNVTGLAVRGLTVGLQAREVVATCTSASHHAPVAEGETVTVACCVDVPVRAMSSSAQYFDVLLGWSSPGRGPVRHQAVAHSCELASLEQAALVAERPPTAAVHTLGPALKLCFSSRCCDVYTPLRRCVDSVLAFVATGTLPSGWLESVHFPGELHAAGRLRWRPRSLRPRVEPLTVLWTVCGAANVHFVPFFHCRTRPGGG